MGSCIGDGETGLNIKIKNLGYKFGFNGKSIIYHIIPPHRMTQSYLNGRLANQGNANCYTLFREKTYNNFQLVRRIIKHSAAVIAMIFITTWSLTTRHSWRMSLAKLYYYLSMIKYNARIIFSASWRDYVLKDDLLKID